MKGIKLSIEHETVNCGLCPHSCRLRNNELGFCGVRRNVNNEIDLPYYGRLSSIAIDPIEKKPLYHFFPGSRIFSIGFLGCNLRCPFCQNFSISQNFQHETSLYSPSEIADAAENSGSKLMAFTYSEPVIHFEYILETALIARGKGIKTVLVTNGFLNKEPAEELLSAIDATNVDLKSYNDEFYHNELKGNLQTVLDFIETASRLCHLEVTTLVIPGRNNTIKEIEAIAKFLAKLNPRIPFHLSCYYPRYKYTIRPTTYEDLEPLIKIAQNYLEYVYAGNTGFGNDTRCSKCGNLLISRKGFSVTIKGFSEGRCTSCNTDIPIVVA